MVTAKEESKLEEDYPWIIDNMNDLTLIPINIDRNNDINTIDDCKKGNSVSISHAKCIKILSIDLNNFANGYLKLLIHIGEQEKEQLRLENEVLFNIFIFFL